MTLFDLAANSDRADSMIKQEFKTYLCSILSDNHLPQNQKTSSIQAFERSLTQSTPGYSRGACSYSRRKTHARLFKLLLELQEEQTTQTTVQYSLDAFMSRIDPDEFLSEQGWLELLLMYSQYALNKNNESRDHSLSGLVNISGHIRNRFYRNNCDSLDILSTAAKNDDGPTKAIFQPLASNAFLAFAGPVIAVLVTELQLMTDPTRQNLTMLLNLLKVACVMLSITNLATYMYRSLSTVIEPNNNDHVVEMVLEQYKQYYLLALLYKHPQQVLEGLAHSQTDVNEKSHWIHALYHYYIKSDDETAIKPLCQLAKNSHTQARRFLKDVSKKQNLSLNALSYLSVILEDYTMFADTYRQKPLFVVKTLNDQLFKRSSYYIEWALKSLCHIEQRQRYQTENQSEWNALLSGLIMVAKYNDLPPDEREKLNDQGTQDALTRALTVITTHLSQLDSYEPESDYASDLARCLVDVADFIFHEYFICLRSESQSVTASPANDQLYPYLQLSVYLLMYAHKLDPKIYQAVDNIHCDNDQRNVLDFCHLCLSIYFQSSYRGNDMDQLFHNPPSEEEDNLITYFQGVTDSVQNRSDLSEKIKSLKTYSHNCSQNEVDTQDQTSESANTPTVWSELHQVYSRLFGHSNTDQYANNSSVYSHGDSYRKLKYQ